MTFSETAAKWKSCVMDYLIAALDLGADFLYRSPYYIFEAKCLDQFHNTLWEAFKDQYIRQETPDFYAKLLAAEKEART